MENSCHRCGASVENGVLFCRHCGAPQIRVAIETPTTPEPLNAPDVDTHLDVPSPQRSSRSLHWAPARAATVLAGLLEALFTIFGVWFIGIPAGAFFSVAFYKKRAASVNLDAALGARLGLISGAIGFVIFAVMGSLEMLLDHGGGLREEVMKQLQQKAAQYPAQAQQALQYLQSSQGWGLIVALSTIFTLIAFLFLSTIGGVIGGAVLGKKDRKNF